MNRDYRTEDDPEGKNVYCIYHKQKKFDQKAQILKVTTPIRINNKNTPSASSITESETSLKRTYP